MTASRALRSLESAQKLAETCELLIEISHPALDVQPWEVRTTWAIEMGFIRIGEEVSRLPEAVRARFTDQPWRLIIALRNMAAHQYDSLENPRVRRYLATDVPALRDYVRDVMIPALQKDLDRERRDETTAPEGGPE